MLPTGRTTEPDAVMAPTSTPELVDDSVGIGTVTTGYGTSVAVEAVIGPIAVSLELVEGEIVTEAVAVLEMVSVKTIVAVEFSTGTTTEPEPEMGPTDTAEVGTVTVTTG